LIVHWSLPALRHSKMNNEQSTMNNEQYSDFFISKISPICLSMREWGRPAAAASGAATSLAFNFLLGDDVTRKFDILEISRPHDAATMPQMRIRFRPSDAFLPSMRGATVRGK
jgi:hypothetical protein